MTASAPRLSTYLRTRHGEFVDIFSPEAHGEGRAYPEGAIELVLSGKAVLTTDLWDDIEFLWWYLVDMVAQFFAHGSGRMDFPDQPLTATLTRRRGDWLLFEVTAWRGREVITSSSVREKELVGLLATEGAKTLRRLTELNPANTVNNERALARLFALAGALAQQEQSAGGP
ncbi:hypothetical protein [Nocardiopsis ansamitocini]|uniref:Uncharacterized protein n=1 Tax=Nocardiopsis ansamitocini TaxID=1670832 RepID=A0A9W6UHX4_9ACTN|nr:hypothetical protein [Nocardiopsis ansamitocini]GLU47147.1 hypothetical protein Nans01_14980 [Nocardiopsis ansamitocini]